MRIAWIMDFDHKNRRTSGAYFRYINISQQLQALGHSVYVLVRYIGDDRTGNVDYFEQIKEEGTITDFAELDWKALPRAQGFTLLVPSPRFLRKRLETVDADVRACVVTKLNEWKIDACLISSRRALWNASWLAKMIPTCVDFCDCLSLVLLRELQLHLRRGEVSRILRDLRDLEKAILEESYFCRNARTSFVVSPVDERAMRILSLGKSQIEVLPNGVAVPSMVPIRKIAGRIAFSGIMDFPPNVVGAVWFVKEVLPRIRETNPEARLVLIGARPSVEVMELKSDVVEVTGYVDDVSSEIAKSAVYVAPILSGTGFRNKVVEALASGTFIVATKRATEFLPDELRKRIPSVVSAREMAERVRQVLDDPDHFNAQTEELCDLVRKKFTWNATASQLVCSLERTVGHKKCGSDHSV